MQGIVGFGGYIPHWRLDRSTIPAVTGRGGGTGTRSVAGYDEDALTLAVEAARVARRTVPTFAPDLVLFSTVSPPYLDKTNATALHAALHLDPAVPAFDANGSVRAAVGALRLGLERPGTTLVVAADLRDGRPGSADESSGGDAAAALVVGVGDAEHPVVAEYLGGAARSDEFLDRWRTPGDRFSRVWEERFGETRYVPLGHAAWTAGLERAGITPDEVTRLVIAGPHERARGALARRLNLPAQVLADDLHETVGNCGAAQPALLLGATLEAAAPGDVIALLTLADGADALFFRATDRLAEAAPAMPVAGQVATGEGLDYGTFLRWRGELVVEPPRRPEPARVSASAAGRSEEWKFGFVASRDRTTGALHLPPARVSREGGAIDEMDLVPMADVLGTVATFTVDRLAYSPSPPVVFAVVDFDGGGRTPLELTDVDPDRLSIGDRVEMTFRRLSTTEGIHNYFWKARPIRP